MRARFRSGESSLDIVMKVPVAVGAQENPVVSLDASCLAGGRVAGGLGPRAIEPPEATGGRPLRPTAMCQQCHGRKPRRPAAPCGGQARATLSEVVYEMILHDK